MKYIKKFNQHNLYEAFVVGAEFVKPNLSLCVEEDEVHYTQYTPDPPKFLDILYSDSNGNLSYTSTVLSASAGKTPIALCIAGQDFFGINEKARWMSLKYMNYTTPDTGSLTPQDIYVGTYSKNVETINDIQSTTGNGGEWGYMDVDYYDNSSQLNHISNVLTENNEWNISKLGTVNQYATTDIDGKNKTAKFLTIATSQPTWQTDVSISNQYWANYAPAACCCWRYHTLGTQQGDWYLCGCGEMSIIVARKTDINNKLTTISTVYSNDCIDSLSESNGYWTSTEYNDNISYRVYLSTANISNGFKNNNLNVIGMLQY